MPDTLHGVLFDYGLTLAGFSRPDQALHEAYTEIAGRLVEHGPLVDPARLLAAVHDRLEAAVRDHERSGRRREIDLRPLHAGLYAELGYDLSAELLDELAAIEQRAWWNGVTAAPAAHDVLRTLRARGLRVGLCSNAPYRATSLRAQLRHLQLDTLLDSVVFSSEVGWRKPSPRIFRAALRGLGTKPEHTVMVGDRVREDVEGARVLGITPIRTRQFDDDRRRAAPHLVIGDLRELPALLAQ